MNCSELDSDNSTFPAASLYTKVAGSALFVIVWPFIVLDMSFFPLGRPAAALVGATLMVLFQVVYQSEVYEIEGEVANLRTIFLLVGMMMLSYYFDREGLLNMVTLKIFGKDKPFRSILWKVCVMSAVLSAFITNDAACLVVTPLLMTEFMNQGRDKIELLPLCLGIATSANIGSAATFFGNPQNAYIASQTGVELLQFFIAELPAALLGMATNIGALYLFHVIRLKVLCGTKSTNKMDDEQNNLLASSSSNNSGPVLPHIRRSISQERKEFVLSFDRSMDPATTSPVSIEREKLWQTSSRERRSHTDCFLRLDGSQQQLSEQYVSLSSSQHNISSQHSSQVPSRYRRREHNTSQSTRPSRSNIALQETSLSYSTIQEDERSNKEMATIDNTCISPGVKGTQSNIPNKCTWVCQKLFIVWLILVTILVIVLLVIPQGVASFDLGCVPLAASILTMLMDTLLNRKYAYDVMAKIDWAVILMFMGLFVWLRGFENTSFPCLAFNSLKPHMNLNSVTGVIVFSVFVIVGSNIFSNVPLVILIADQVSQLCGSGNTCEPLPGLLLAWISTIAGNFTLIGSVANLIVAEKVRKSIDYKLSFSSYIVFGFPSTLVILYSCLPVVYFMGKYVASEVHE